MTRRGYTLLETMVVITIVAGLAALVVPMLGTSDRIRLSGAASIIGSDIELAQVMTIGFPEDPVVVRFDEDAATYWLAYASDTETPILRADTGAPYRVVLGTGRAASAEGVSLTIDGMTGDMIEFDAQGGLVDFSAAPTITLALGTLGLEMALSTATGSISENEITISVEEGGGGGGGGPIETIEEDLGDGPAEFAPRR